MSVKGIFKILIGTIAIIVVSSLLVEYFNLTLYSNQVKRLTKLSVNKALQYFSQETYKREDANAMCEDILGNDGSIAVSSNFYGSIDGNTIYENLYLTNQNFKNWCSMYADNWTIAKTFYSSINNETTGDDFKRMIMQYWKDEKYTPANMGIAYVDNDVVKNIAIWNLVKVLCNGNQDNVVVNDGEPYVLYNGYKVYYNTLELTNVDYTIYDLRDDSDKEKFEKLTHLNTDNMGFSSSDNIPFISNTDAERKKVCVLDLSYSVKLKYDGITPFKQIISYVWNTEVEGINGAQPRRTSLGTPLDTGTLKGGSANNISTLPVQDNIIYYIIH